MKKPILKGVIQPEDVYKKGQYKYVSWARTSEYLNELAPGWQFHLEMPPSVEATNVIWVAGDGTGYLMGYFTDPEGKKGALFPYSIMDYKNNPIKYEKISARDVTDSHRRAFVATAAKEFDLGSELWTGNEITKATTQPANYKRGGAEPKQNIAVLARDAIVKSTTDKELDNHANTLASRLDEGKISEVEYLKLNDLITSRRKALTA